MVQIIARGTNKEKALFNCNVNDFGKAGLTEVHELMQVVDWLTCIQQFHTSYSIYINLFIKRAGDNATIAKITVS